MADTIFNLSIDAFFFPFFQDHFLTCFNAGSEKSNFLIESMTPEELQLQANGVCTPEVLAVAIVIDSTIILEKERLYATVELKGEFSRGMMVIDKRGFLNKESNVSIIKTLDLGKTQGLFAGIFTSTDFTESPSPISPVSRDHSAGIPVLYREVKLTVS